MQLVDANVVLRYILWDNDELAHKAEQILENEKIEIPFEVIAEVVYVLISVYKVERAEIKTSLLNLINYSNIFTKDDQVLKTAFNIFCDKKLDFIDSILIGYNQEKASKVFSFDKKLNKLLR